MSFVYFDWKKVIQRKLSSIFKGTNSFGSLTDIACVGIGGSSAGIKFTKGFFKVYVVHDISKPSQSL